MSAETLNLNVNLENLTAEERDNLMKLVEKSQEKSSKVWKPRLGETYFSLNHDGGIKSISWNNGVCDNARFEIGNVFPTREAAEEEVTRRRMLTKWKRLSIESGEENNPWDCSHAHWCVTFDHAHEEISCTNIYNVRPSSVFFPNEKALEAAIEELGKDNVKKYILGVKE